MDRYEILFNEIKENTKEIETISRFRLMDDDFMSLFFDGNIECTKFVLSVILRRDDFEVIDVVTQKEFKGMNEHSVIMDVIVKTDSGEIIDIEIQRSDKGAVPRRGRYYIGMLDKGLLKPGDDYGRLPETYVIFITEQNYFGAGLPMYHVDRHIKELQMPFEDGAHIIYVNGQYRGIDAVGDLMHDFQCSNPEEIKSEVLSKRFKYLKTTEKGSASMSDLFDERANELIKERIIAKIKEMEEQVKKETIERVEKETAERVEKETAERVERETAERVERETAAKEKKNMIKAILDSGKMTFDEIVNVFKIPENEEKELRMELEAG